MKLADLRKLSIRSQSRIRFRLRSGMECVITEHGIAQVPALGGIPDFNLEEELAGAGEFLLEPAAPHAKGERKAAAPRMVGREELSGMVSHAAVAGARSEEE